MDDVDPSPRNRSASHASAGGPALHWRQRRSFQAAGLEQELAYDLLQLPVLTLELFYLVTGCIPDRIARQSLLAGLPIRLGGSSGAISATAAHR